jgi:hypothetical protein
MRSFASETRKLMSNNLKHDDYEKDDVYPDSHADDISTG